MIALRRWTVPVAVGVLVGGCLTSNVGDPRLGAGPAGAVTPPVFSVVERRLTTAAGEHYDPAISGDLVVYSDTRGLDMDIWYTDLTTGQEHPVTLAPGNQELTDVSGRRIAYSDYDVLEVRVFDVDTGTTLRLPPGGSAPYMAIDPAISGDLVAWTSTAEGNPEIHAYDLATGEERRVSAWPGVDFHPAVTDGVIVWERCDSNGICDIWAYDWATGVTTQVTDTPTDDERSPDISGRTIVYQGTRGGEPDAFAYDLDTGVERRLSLAGGQYNPNVAGQWVSFDDVSTGTYHIWLWDLATGRTYRVTADVAGAGQYLNDIDGDRIVYTDDRNGYLDIYLSTFTLTPPPFTIVAAPDAATVQPDAPLSVPAPGVLANDTVADPTDVASVTVAVAPTKGTVTTIGLDGSFAYAPNAGVAGTTDAFTYRITDVYGRTADAVVTLTITGAVVDRDHVTITLTGGYALRLDGDLTKGAVGLVTAKGALVGVVGGGQLAGTVTNRPATVAFALASTRARFVGVITIVDPGTGFARLLTYAGTAVRTDARTVTGHGTVFDPAVRPRDRVTATIDWTVHDGTA